MAFLLRAYCIKNVNLWKNAISDSFTVKLYRIHTNKRRKINIHNMVWRNLCYVYSPALKHKQAGRDAWQLTWTSVNQNSLTQFSQYYSSHSIHYLLNTQFEHITQFIQQWARGLVWQILNSNPQSTAGIFKRERHKCIIYKESLCRIKSKFTAKSNSVRCKMPVHQDPNSKISCLNVACSLVDGNQKILTVTLKSEEFVIFKNIF